jgi:hypothetical protein
MFFVQPLVIKMIQKPPRCSRCLRSYLVAEDETSPERRLVLHGQAFILPFLSFYIGLMFLYESVMGLRRHEGQGCILADEMFCLAFPFRCLSDFILY